MRYTTHITQTSQAYAEGVKRLIDPMVVITKKSRQEAAARELAKDIISKAMKGELK
jgi:hypothetical protein